MKHRLLFVLVSAILLLSSVLTGCAPPAQPTAAPAAPAAAPKAPEPTKAPAAPVAAPTSAPAPTKAPAAPATAPTAVPTAAPKAPEPTKAPAAAPTSAPAPAGQAKKGGTLRVAIGGDCVPNPFTLPNQLPTLLVHKNLFSVLVRYDQKDLSLVPDLATEWKLDPGGKSWTFKLRQGVKWHDGKPFTAADVKFTLENIMNPKVNALMRSNIALVTTVDVIDDYTVRINTKEPFPSLPIQLGYNIVMAPKHLLDGQDLNTLTDFVQKPVGTGPFKFKENVKGDHITLVANDDYYFGRPNVDSIVYKIVPDVNIIVAQLKAGDLDVAAVEPQHMAALAASSNIEVRSVPVPHAYYISLNNTVWPFTDKLVRQALMYGLDRKLIVDKLLLNVSEQAAGAYAPAFGVYRNAKLQPYPFDAEKAKALLAQAGFKAGSDGILAKDGKRFAFTLLVDKGNPTKEQIILTTQQYWKKLGIDVTVEINEWSVHVPKSNAPDFQATSYNRITAPDPDKTAEYGTGGSVNAYHYSNPKADELLAAGRSELDQAKRITIYNQLQEVLYDDVPVVWIYYPNDVIAVSKNVQDWPQMGIRDALIYAHKAWLK